MASQKRRISAKTYLFLCTQAMTKTALPGVPAQRGVKQLSLEARIDAVVTLALMANGMDLPTGAIAKVANTSIVLELAIQKFDRG